MTIVLLSILPQESKEFILEMINSITDLIKVIKKH